MNSVFLSKILAEANIKVSDEQLTKLCAFYELVTEWNEKFNLTRIVSEEDAAVKHFCDSLLAAEYVSGTVCDVGSGAGFPAIPLAVVCPDADFTLVEANGKKVGFLEFAVESLGLNNVRVLKARAEELPTLRGSFDVVTARAVAELNTLSEYCLPLVKVGGRFIAYKGSNYETELLAAENAFNLLGAEKESINTYSLPISGDFRALIVAHKISETPAKYPRGQGKPRSKPL